MGFRGEYRSHLAAEATKEITGTDPRKSSSGMAEHEQRRVVSSAIAGFVRSGQFDPYVLMQSLVAGLAFLADNFGVSRAKLVEMLTMAKLPEDRSLLWLPPSFGTPSGDTEK